MCIHSTDIKLRKQSPLFLSELTWYKMTTTYYVEGPGPVADLFAITYFVSYWQNYLLIWGVDFSNIYHVCSLGAINVSCFNLVSFTYIPLVNLFLPNHQIKRQLRIDNPETLTTLGIRHRTKTKKNTQLRKLKTK